MSWLYLLGIVAVVVALAALSGVKPQGSRPVARTRMMTVARVVLGVLAVLLLVAFARSWV